MASLPDRRNSAIQGRYVARAWRSQWRCGSLAPCLGMYRNAAFKRLEKWNLTRLFYGRFECEL